MSTRTKAKLTGKRCECTSCGEFFSTVANFDKHRKKKGSSRVCVDPESVGLVIGEKATNTFWRMPSEFEVEILSME